MTLPILFPNVPNVPGVPQLARSGLFPVTPTPELGNPAVQGALWQSASGAPTWGIFDAKGKLVVDPDNIVNFDNRNEWRISTYPVQQGQFAQYNKVAVPYEISVRLTKGKTKTERKNFLASIDKIAGDLNLYTIVSPERSYVGVNVLRYEVARRGVQGAFFLAEVDIYFIQIQEVQPQYSTTGQATANAQDPTAFDPVNGGLVQPLTPADFSSAGGALAQFPDTTPFVDTP